MIPLVGMLGEVARILRGEDREAMAMTVAEAAAAITRHNDAMVDMQRNLDAALAAAEGRKLEILTDIPQGPAPGEMPPPPKRARRSWRTELGVTRPRGVRIPPEALFGDAPISNAISRAEAEAAARAFYYDEVKGHPTLGFNGPRWEDLSDADRDQRIRRFTD